jgi:hypothetical protein
MAEIGLDGDSLSLRAGRVALRRLEPVVITARDGLLLNGYLTRPAAAVGNPPPLLLAMAGRTGATPGGSARPTNGSQTAAMRC